LGTRAQCNTCMHYRHGCLLNAAPPPSAPTPPAAVI
jgi:hypothetical protein